MADHDGAPHWSARQGHDMIRRMHRAICSPLVDEGLFRTALGGPRSDLAYTVRLLQIPPARRPDLSFYFDRLFYAVTNLDLAATGQDMFLHFIEQGLAQRRRPHPLIDLSFINACEPHVLAGPEPEETLHELLEYDLVRPSAYFDLAWYREQLGHFAPGRALLSFFLQVGLPRGDCPNAFFDPAWYIRRYEDVPRHAFGAVRHLAALGDRQGRATSPAFDGTQYLRRYRDVGRSDLPPLAHFLEHGVGEGRHATPHRAAVFPVLVSSAAPELPGLPAPIDPARSRAIYQSTCDRIGTAKAARRVGTGAAPHLHTSSAPKRDVSRIVLPPAPRPRLSVLIPVFNEIRHTVECLLALSAAFPQVSTEVIVADDASTDGTGALLSGISNLRLIRQASNRGFIRTCNAAVLQCRAPVILMLNNDTQVQPGAIDRMLAVLDTMPDVAAVGPKLVYPDGQLQEAGCAVRLDGRSEMIGLNEDPAEPRYNHDRDVAYCSGAALMVRRALVGDQLFDPVFEPAYCEDADLCLRLLERGHRIRYVHDAVVVHHLSVSSGRQPMARRHRNVIRNQHALAARRGGVLRRLNQVRVLAFYLPQFHPTPENDLWWGKGFTEWTNVARARPAFPGHYQPHLPTDLGFYDLRSGEALAAQAQLARRYGIEGFCVYSYHLGGRRLLSRPLDVVRADPTIPFHWCLCWANENWTRRWDGGDGEVLAEQSYDAETLAAVIADAVDQARDERYIRVRGRPLFLVYRPLLLPDPCGFAADCRTAFAAAGFPGVHLAFVESMEMATKARAPAEFGFDAAVEFPPHGMGVPAGEPVTAAEPAWDGMRYSYGDSVAAFCARNAAGYARYPAVFPSWDNTPRQPRGGDVFEGATPEAFQAYVEAKAEEARCFLPPGETFLFVNAWNEWAEGAHLEPDAAWGHCWLQALRDGVEASLP